MITRTRVLEVLAAILLGVCIVAFTAQRASDPPQHLAPAALPVGEPLPIDAFVFDSDRTGTFEIFLQLVDGTVTQLTDDPSVDTWWGRISPDRRTVLVQQSPAGEHDRDYGVVSVSAMASDGTEMTMLRPAGLDGWPRQGHPEWSPDGERLTLFGGPDGWSPQIYITDALGQNPQPVTDRPGTNLDPSFSPDGAQIVFVGCPMAVCTEASYEIYVTDLEGSEAKRLTSDKMRDHDPYVSPDGSTVAWLTQTVGVSIHPAGAWNIRSAPFDGVERRPSEVTMVTDDLNVNSRPVFTADGAWIYFHRLVYSSVDLNFDVYRIRPDGSEMSSLTEGQPGVNEYPGT